MENVDLEENPSEFTPLKINGILQCVSKKYLKIEKAISQDQRFLKIFGSEQDNWLQVNAKGHVTLSMSAKRSTCYDDWDKPRPLKSYPLTGLQMLENHVGYKFALFCPGTGVHSSSALTLQLSQDLSLIILACKHKIHTITRKHNLIK